jgi:hypothetical protein
MEISIILVTTHLLNYYMKLLARGFFLLLLTAALFSSCKKESSSNSSNNTHYVKFKVKGNWVTWNKVFARIITGSGSPSESGFELLSQSQAGTEKLNMGITVEGSNFTSKIYSPDNSFMAVSYIKNAGTPNFETYTGGGFLGGSDTRYEITITSITDEEVKGKFSGSYLRNASDDEDLLEITEGEFAAARIP